MIFHPNSFFIKKKYIYILQEKYPEKTIKGHSSAIKSLMYQQELKILISGSFNGVIKLWDVNENYRQTRQHQNHSGSVNCLLDAGNGINFLSAGWDQKIFIYDFRNESSISTIEDTNNFTEKIVYMRDGRTLVSGGNDRNLRIWRQNLPQISLLNQSQLGVSQLNSEINQSS